MNTNIKFMNTQASTSLTKKLISSALAGAILLGAPTLAVSQAAQAAEASDNLTAAKRLNQLLVNTKSMTANFKQTTKGANSTKGGISAQNGTFSGTMSLKRPNNFRWNITSPSEQLIVTNGSHLWVYDKDLEQVTRQNTDNQVGNTPALLLSGDPSKISKNFKITQPNGNKNYYVLYPKSSNANFKNLAISFSGGKPVMMVLNDSLGQVTSIKFTNVKMNPSIANSQFNFKAPAGVDVINQ